MLVGEGEWRLRVKGGSREDIVVASLVVGCWIG